VILIEIVCKTQDSSSGYVGPAWRPIDRHQSLLATTAPSLLLVETIAVQQLETASEVKKDKWRLLPDPGESTHRLIFICNSPMFHPQS
jgi:hypothetical protein